jgi:Inner membrane protein YgaP-like, transmembrane domain
MISSAGTGRAVLGRPHGKGSRQGWRTVNITPAERAGRIVLGLAAAVAGIVLLAGAGSVLAVVLEALLVAAGLDLAVTGALGHCPLYAKLGYLPKSLRGTR